MNLLLHLCWKDLRRLWIPLVLFTAVLASKLMLGAALLWRIDPNDTVEFGRIGLYANLAGLMEFFIGYVLAAAIVHEDVLVGTTAFWMTKPISGLRLLGSKIFTLLFVFLILPCVVTLPWWIACGLSLRATGLAALVVAVPFSMIALAGATVATLTANFSRFIVWTIAFIAGFTILAATRSMHAWSVWGEVTNRANGARNTAYALTAITMAVGLAAVIFHQYRTRRFWRSCGLLAGVLLVAFSFSPWWRWDLLSRFDHAAPATAEAQALTLEVSNISLRKFPEAKFGDLRTELIVRGIPPGQLVVPLQLDATFGWRDFTWDRPRQFGSSTSTDGSLLPTLLNLPPPPNPTQDNLSARRWVGHALSAPEPHTARITYNTSLLPSLAARFEKDPPSYAASVSLRLCKLELTGEIPLAAGQVIALDSYSARVVRRGIFTTRGLEFGVIECQGLTSDQSLILTGFGAGDPLADRSFVLVNRSKRNFVTVDTTTAQSLSVSGVLITWRQLNASAQPHWDDTTNRFVRDADWFDHVSIVATRRRPLATIHRRLEIESATVAAALAKHDEPWAGEAPGQTQ